MPTVLEKTDALLEQEILKQSIPESVKQLVDILGKRLVATIGDVKQTRTVREWIVRERDPQANRPQLLQFALQVARRIAERHGQHTAQGWFQGLNHHLNNHVPALELKSVSEAELSRVYEVERQVWEAARNFLER